MNSNPTRYATGQYATRATAVRAAKAAARETNRRQFVSIWYDDTCDISPEPPGLWQGVWAVDPDGLTIPHG